jgi:hypothetical protein
VKAPPKLRNIARVKANPAVDRATGGWLVRFTRKGKMTQVYIGDHGHGGEAASLKAAMAERDRLEQTLKPSATVKAERLLDPKRGVRICLKETKRNGRYYIYEYAEAVWSDRPGEITRRRFSVRVYGRKGALALARQTRQAAIEKILKRRP